MEIDIGVLRKELDDYLTRLQGWQFKIDELKGELSLTEQQRDLTQSSVNTIRAAIEALEKPFPRKSGDVIVIGPECITDGNVISYKGKNYVRQ